MAARLYLVGGSSAVIEGWRESTLDIDLRLEPDDDALLRELTRLKERLDVNVELASPLDFLPELPVARPQPLPLPRRPHRRPPP